MLRLYGLEEMIRKITPLNTRGSYDTRKLSVFVNWWLFRDVAMFRPTCLKRSLILYRFLRESACPVRIHYGVKKKPTGGHEGHSWLSLDGKPIPPDGDEAGEFRETFSFPREVNK